MVLTLNEMVSGVVMGSLLLVGVMSLLSRILQSRVECKLVKERVVCRLCGHSYRNERHEFLSKCELCGAANRMEGNGKLG